MKNIRAPWSLLLAALVLLAGSARAQQPARPAWSERTVELFATLPVQEGGRVKPLDSYAQFQLLKMNGKRRFEAPSGEKITPTVWLLDCLFFPEVARSYRTFHVRDQAVLEAVGLRIEGRRKSDRYSYDELAPAREKLFEEGTRIHAIDPKRRDAVESQLYGLAASLRDFEGLIHGLEFARVVLPTGGTPLLRETFGEGNAGLAWFVERLEEAQTDLSGKLEALGETERQAESEALAHLEEELSHAARASSALTIFPPESASVEEWRSVDGALEEAFHGADQPLSLLAAWEAVERAKGDPATFESALGALHGRVTAIAQRRGEYDKVPLEVSFYRSDYFTRALVAYLAAFLAVCASWLAPKQRWIVRGAWGLTALGTVLVVVGVVLRCVIRERPPVLTLYDTILFITGCCAIVLLVMEWIQRGRIALALAPLLGAAGMFLAMKYELKEAVINGDTIAPLIAVLDTNFYLATHVTTITLGYAAGLMAAALANVWLIGKMIGLKRGDREFYRSLSRMTYGVVCFGLLFSVVGTILGGVWANDSWGRFWGWDPKENGALLICLGELFILHARMGGYIREHGLAALAALNGLAVAFSWWHVNHLEVGLHSYGKTEGVLVALYTYYGLGLLVVLGSLVWRLGTRQAAPQVAAVAERAPASAQQPS